MYLTDQWTGSIKFCCQPVNKLAIGLPLEKLSVVPEIDICDYLGYSNSDRSVSRLYLDPHKYDQPPQAGEPVSKNPQWIQLKAAFEAAAHIPGRL